MGLRIFVAGATGYIGKHVARELARRGHQVVGFARPRSDVSGLGGAEVRLGEVTSLDPGELRGFDAVVSCLATRTGGVKDSWLIEHQASLRVLQAAKAAGVKHFVLLSAICVQKPLLQFQKAKLAFESELIGSGMTWSIVRPTAFFKSLSGQVERVKGGAPFLVFGDGELTACKPISEADLARFIADCLEDPARRNAVLPVGGPGPAITPKQQGSMLFELCGREPRFRHVPVRLMDFIVAALSIIPGLGDKAEYARIGRYYGTESMLVLSQTGYDDAATPSYGSDTLRDFYARVLKEGLKGQELGSHAAF